MEISEGLCNRGLSRNLDCISLQGDITSPVTLSLGVSQAIVVENNALVGVCDARKDGAPAGY